MQDKLKSILFLIACYSFLLLSSLCYAVGLDTQVSQQKVTLDETFNISYTLTGDHQVSPDFSPLEKDFHVIGTQYGNAIHMINGVTTKQTMWRLTLKPKQTGDFLIPEINFSGMKSSSYSIKVIDTPNATDNTSQDIPVFVQAELSSPNAYIQSQVIYTFKLFYQSQLENPSIEMPEVKDGTFLELGQGKQYEAMVKGKPFFVVEKNFAFFPQNAGKLLIPPMRFRALNYGMDNNIGYPFYVSAPQSIQLATKPVSLEVEKIPDAFQGSTWLPAKNIIMREKWSIDPNQWKVGDPVTRTIVIEAHGLRGDQIPDVKIEQLDGINMYVDPPKRANRIESNSVIGTLEQKVTYIPNHPQSYTIPALTLNWWNLQTNQNEIAQLNKLNGQIKGKLPTSIFTPSDTLPNETLMNKPMLNVSEKIKIMNNPFYASIWFWIAMCLLGIWLLTLWLVFGKKYIGKYFSKSDKPIANTGLNETEFRKACEQGNAFFAQQYLLAWAKKQWHVTYLNLERLRDSVEDENFKHALKELEQALYDKKPTEWQGQSLLETYQKIKKQKKQVVFSDQGAKASNQDPLPPLYP